MMDILDIEKTCFFTGHRIIPNAEYSDIADTVKKLCIKLIEEKDVSNFITGGALGFDTLAARIVLDLKNVYPHIKLHIYLPCTNQHEKWCKYDRKMWEALREAADSVYYVTNDVYTTGCMQLRNHAMVKDARYCIGYCKRRTSGTYSTIKYAKEHDRKIILI